MATRRIVEFLDGNNVKYVMDVHPEARSAQEVAAAAHVPGAQFAKTVVVCIDTTLALAVVPANCQVDVVALRAEIGARYVEIADRDSFSQRFEGCQFGAMPPFGDLFGMQTYVDHSLAKCDDIAFSSGTHDAVIWMRFSDYRRLAHPHLMNFASRIDESEVPMMIAERS